MQVSPGVFLLGGIAGAVSIALHQWLPLEIGAVVVLLMSGVSGFLA